MDPLPLRETRTSPGTHYSKHHPGKNSRNGRERNVHPKEEFPGPFPIPEDGWPKQRAGNDVVYEARLF